MKSYSEFISDYLDHTAETIDAFARRAGVHRSSVYRAKAGDNLLFSVVEKMVQAAGGRLSIASTKRISAKQVSQN